VTGPAEQDAPVGLPPHLQPGVLPVTGGARWYFAPVGTELGDPAWREVGGLSEGLTFATDPDLCAMAPYGPPVRTALGDTVSMSFTLSRRRMGRLMRLFKFVPLDRARIRSLTRARARGHRG